MRSTIVPAVLLLVAVIHALPVIGVLGASRLTALYGIAVDNADLALLLRHRAVLFGLLAAFQAVASFVVLTHLAPSLNTALTMVYRVDLVAMGLLLAAGAVHLTRPA
jgi:hypothetical protein